MLTPKENLVRELAQSATEGTWQRFGTDIDSVVSVEGEEERMGVAEWVAPKDACFIVAVQPQAVLQILTRLEEALEENERLLGIARKLDDFVGYSGTEYLDIEEYQWWQSIDLAKEGDVNS